MAVYLDHNATTPPLPAARAAMLAALEAGGNPSSVHAAGRAARRTVEEARAAVADLVCAFPAEVIFTSGGSEANALALRGVAEAGGVKAILAGETEHDSVLANALDAYRKQHGPFQAVSDIRQVMLVTDSVYQKLSPYLVLG